jgi:hypothetical protein
MCQLYYQRHFSLYISHQGGDATNSFFLIEECKENTGLVPEKVVIGLA